MYGHKFYKETKKGIISTIIFHVLLGGLLLMWGYSTPLPLPGEEGILINFGDSDEGFGVVEPKITETIEEVITPTPQPQSQPEPVEEQNLTQDYEEAPAIEEKKPEEKKVEKPVDKDIKPVDEKVEEKVEEVKEPVKEKPREVNKKALFPGKSNQNQNSTNQGEAGGKGNQGKPEGDPASNNYVGGPSNGSKGVSFSLSGRNPESLPEPQKEFKEEGYVVVRVTVNKDGDVVKAEPGVQGSTTLDAQCLKLAKKAALRAKFDRKPDAPAYQKGTITYHFKLQ